jgi:hypothetical protein
VNNYSAALRLMLPRHSSLASVGAENLSDEDSVDARLHGRLIPCPCISFVGLFSVLSPRDARAHRPRYRLRHGWFGAVGSGESELSRYSGVLPPPEAARDSCITSAA